VVGQENLDITNALQLTDVAMATMFWLSMCGVHIGIAIVFLDPDFL